MDLSLEHDLAAFDSTLVRLSDLSIRLKRKNSVSTEIKKLTEVKNKIVI